MKLFELLVLALLPAICQGARIEPADFKGGESWTYEITTTSGGLKTAQYQQEYAVLWQAERERFVTGQRRAASGTAWVPGKDFEVGRCMLFIPDPTIELGSQFCSESVGVGLEIQADSATFSRRVKFEGVSSAPSPLGFFRAARYTVVDHMKGVGDSAAPSATQRRWQFWYVPELRGFIRMNLEFVDSVDRVVSTVSMNLIATNARKGFN